LQLTSSLAELGLDIQEAHAFSTIDGYSLDVFVVTGWHLGVQSCSLLHDIVAIDYLLFKYSISSAMFMLLMIISFPAISRVPSSYKESYFRNFTKLRYSFPPILSLSKQITHWNLIFVDKNKIAFSLLGETLFYFSESS